jgi:hypothetical protein
MWMQRLYMAEPVEIAPLITVTPALERKNRAHTQNVKMKAETSDVCRWARR